METSFTSAVVTTPSRGASSTARSRSCLSMSSSFFAAASFLGSNHQSYIETRHG